MNRTFRNSLRLFVFLVFPACFYACKEKPKREIPDADEIRERMTNAHRIMVQHESEQISEFSKRHQFKMNETGTGLRYQIYREGNGTLPAQHDEVTLAYRMYNLDDTLLYQADSLHPVRFRLGEGKNIAGLEEGIMMLNSGARARLLVPSHLGYGTQGNEDKIPGATPLYFDIQILKYHHE